MISSLKAVVTGDLKNLEETRRLAARINELGSFDVVHNASEYGVGNEDILNVNSLSPYLLTSLVDPPRQSVYLTSDLHLGGDLKLGELRGGGTASPTTAASSRSSPWPWPSPGAGPVPVSTPWPRAGCRP
ncbi:hypothetical protein [Streptomyces anulatus]|uniref:hypothetical protein n=1 Tax=Streptomyces anulatus TaxID=1892 RepID=UPI00343C59B3